MCGNRSVPLCVVSFLFIIDYDHAGNYYAAVDDGDDDYNDNVRTPTALHHLL